MKLDDGKPCVPVLTFALNDEATSLLAAEGGSWTTASVGSAVHGAALAIAGKLLALANR